MELNFGGLGLAGEAREGRRLLLERAWGKPAKGCGDYFWRTSAEAREGSRRLLLEDVCGSSRRAAAASVSPKVIDTLCKEYLRPGK